MPPEEPVVGPGSPWAPPREHRSTPDEQGSDDRAPAEHSTTDQPTTDRPPAHQSPVPPSSEDPGFAPPGSGLPTRGGQPGPGQHPSGPPTGYGAHPGYGAPSGYGQPPGYGAPPGSGAQPGYGQPSGYGAPPGYGPPTGSFPQPGYGPPTPFPQPGYGRPTGPFPSPGPGPGPGQSVWAPPGWGRPAPGWGGPYPPRPRRPLPWKVVGIVVGALLLIALIVVGLLAFLVGPRFARVDVLDSDAVAQGVTRVVTDEWRRQITDVSCPSDQEVRPGVRFTCSATVDGRPAQVPVTVIGVDGTYSVGQPR